MPSTSEPQDLSAGVWLRLTACAAVGATLLAVVSGSAGLDAAHRLLAALAVPPLVAIVVAAVVAHRRLVAPSVVALALFGAAALLTAHVPHVVAASLAFGATVVVAARTFRGAPVPRASLRDYATLTKPRIMSLLLLTGLCGMFVGAHGVPATWLIAVTMLGLALACGGASALNHVLDRDIDRLMGERTRARPLAADRMPPSSALEFGLALSAFSFVLLASAVNALTASLALVGNLYAAARIPMLPVVRGVRATTRQILLAALPGAAVRRDGARSVAMSVARLRLAPGGETMFPPRAPFFRDRLDPRGPQVAASAEECLRGNLAVSPDGGILRISPVAPSPAHRPKSGL